MRVVSNTEAVDYSVIKARFENLTAQNSGKGYFTEEDVFIASGPTRVLINSLPEVVNIIEHFSFNLAKYRAESVDEMLGRSLFNDQAIADNTQTDVAQMMRGKERELYYRIRKRVWRNRSTDESVKAEIPYIGATTANVTNVHLTDCDPVIEHLVSEGIFNDFSEHGLVLSEYYLVEAVGDFIVEHCPNPDYEQVLDMLRLMLSF